MGNKNSKDDHFKIAGAPENASEVRPQSSRAPTGNEPIGVVSGTETARGRETPSASSVPETGEYRIWYRHSVEPEKTKIPLHSQTSELRQVSKEYILADGRKHQITHLWVEGDLPELPVIAPAVQWLRLQRLTNPQDLERLRELVNLENLEIIEYDMSSGIPNVILELSTLKGLRMVNCQLVDLPDRLADLKLLETLDIGFNKFEELPQCIYNLKNIRSLSLLHNKKLRVIEKDIIQLRDLTQVICDGCHSLETPPYVICEMGCAAIIRYLDEFTPKSADLLDVTAVLVAVIGNTMAGKTSLIESLKRKGRSLMFREENSVYDEATTVFKMSDLQIGNDQLKVIDFSGNDIYHVAYQVTMKERCLPVIVVNMEEFSKVSSSRGPKESAKQLCFSWISHLYLACYQLGPPILVLTHKDRVAEEIFQSSKEQLLEEVETLRQEVLMEEKSLFGQSNDFTKIIHLSNTSSPVFANEDIFVFSDDVTEKSNILALLKNLEMRCDSFHEIIPSIWKKVSTYIEKQTTKPYIPVSDILREFPNSDTKIILRYLHNSGHLLWFENMDELSSYIFHDIEAVTDLIYLLYNHNYVDFWEQTMKQFTAFKYLGQAVELEEYKEKVDDFLTTGILDEAVLFTLVTDKSDYPFEIALALLSAFFLVHGPIHREPRNCYVAPYFSTTYMERDWKEDGKLQLRAKICFKGLAVPHCVFQLMCVGVLNTKPHPIKEVSAYKDGVSVRHGKNSTQFRHDASNSSAIIQTTTSVKQLGASWQHLLSIIRYLLNQVTSVWKAARPVCQFYCSHCIYLREPNPDCQVNPSWFQFSSHGGVQGPTHLALETFSGTEPVKCAKATGQDKVSVPAALRKPCNKLTPGEASEILDYLSLIAPHRNSRVDVDVPNIAGSGHNEPMSSEPGALPNSVSSQTSRHNIPCSSSPLVVRPADDDDSSKVSDAEGAGAAASPGVGPTAPLAEHPDSELSDDLEYLNDSHENMDLISLRVKPCKKRKIRTLFTSKSVYNMSAPIRGRCLIINNQRFDEAASVDQHAIGTREGSQMDLKNISLVFKQLSFDTFTQTDLTIQEMVDVINTETKHKSHNLHGMFVLILMSHGTTDKVYGSDGQTIDLSTIYDCLSPYRFPAMAGKPKVIIIQACSGEQQDVMGEIVHDIPKDTAALQSPEVDPVVQRPILRKHLSTDDLYIMKASFLGYISSSDVRSGSWFIRALVEALYKHACHRDLQSLFFLVKKKDRARSMVSLDGGGQQLTDECTFTGGRKLYLFPDYNPRE